MDGLIDVRLQEQEHALRSVLADLARAHHEVRMLQRTSGWRGPAGSAYDAAVATMEGRLETAEQGVRQALRDTAEAIIARGRCG